MSTATQPPSALPAVVKSNIGIGPRGITPTNLDELFRCATAVSQSGLAPKGIETPQAILVAMEMGLEIGLPLMASLQNIAVINGRPTIWGDAVLAVVRGTGELEEFAEWYEEKGTKLPRNPSNFTDDTVAVVRVKRRGSDANETGFSVADARRAGLWGKAGPWSQYPARMLRFRARGFALRDTFGDALRGLRSAEEVMDDPVSVATNVTPTVPDVPQIPDAEPVKTRKARIQTQPAVVVPDTAHPAEPQQPAIFDGAAQRELEAVFTAAGLTFEDLIKSKIAGEYLDGKEFTSFTELPTEFANRALGRKRDGAVFIGAIRMEKESNA